MPRLNHTVIKEWDDKLDVEQIRPSEIKVQLYCNDVAVKGEEITLTSGNGWVYTWTDLLEEVDDETHAKNIYTVKEMVTSGQDGILNFAQEHAEGTYYLKETKTPNGFVDSNEIYLLTVDSSNRLASLTTIDGTPVKDEEIVNDVPRADLTFVKRAETDSAGVIPNSVYGLYKEKPASVLTKIKNFFTGEENLQLIAKARTDKDGRLTFSGLLTNVEYIVKELEAPVGSYVSENPIKLTFIIENGESKIIGFDDGNGTATMDQDGNITWHEPPVVVSIAKKDIEGNLLAGASLSLTDETGTIIDSWTSAEEEYVLNGVLESGKTYTLTETQAPDGYTLATPQEFTVSDEKVKPNENKIQQVEMINVPIKALVKKIDSDSEETIDGAIFRMTGKFADKTESKEFSPQTTGYLLEQMLIAGQEYTLTELEAPDGYQKLTEPVMIRVDDKGNLSIAESEEQGVASIEETDGVWTLFVENTKIPPEPEKPSEPSNPSEPDEPNIGPNSPAKTGDSSSMRFFLFFMLASFLIGGVVLYRKKKC